MILSTALRGVRRTLALLAFTIGGLLGFGMLVAQPAAASGSTLTITSISPTGAWGVCNVGPGPGPQIPGAPGECGGEPERPYPGPISVSVSGTCMPADGQVQLDWSSWNVVYSFYNGGPSHDGPILVPCNADGTYSGTLTLGGPELALEQPGNNWQTQDAISVSQTGYNRATNGGCPVMFGAFGPPDRLVITSAPLVGAPAGYPNLALTVTLEDSNGNPVTASSNQNFTMVSTSGTQLDNTGTGSFSASFAGPWRDGFAIPAGQSSTTVYYGDAAEGSPILTACGSEPGGSYLLPSSQTETITVQQPQTITITSTPPSPAVYGGSYTPAATGGGSGNPVVFSIDSSSASGACALSGGTVKFTGVGRCVIDANQAGNGGYQAAPQTQQSFTIQPAPLTVKAPSASAYYGSVPSSFTPSYVGLANGDTAPSTPATCSTTATDTSAPGTYPITCSGASDPNYAISYSPGVLTITKAPTNLAAAPASTGLVSITFSATLTRADNSAPIPGKTVVFSVQGHNVCQGTTNSSGVASCTVFPALAITVGQATYTATFAGDADYLARSATGQLTGTFGL